MKLEIMLTVFKGPSRLIYEIGLRNLDHWLTQNGFCIDGWNREFTKPLTQNEIKIESLTNCAMPYPSDWNIVFLARFLVQKIIDFEALAHSP
jgi:hypothetical protein